MTEKELGKAIAEDLNKYGISIRDAVNELTEKAVKDMVKITKQTAPKRTGRYAKAITSTFETEGLGDVVGTWGVKAPYHRATHLLANGHAKRNGGRVPGNPFIQNAYDQVIHEYELGIEREVQNAKP